MTAATLQSMTSRQLREYCRDNKVAGYSKHTRKADLIAFLEGYLSLDLAARTDAVQAVAVVAEEKLADAIATTDDVRKQIASGAIERFDAMSTACTTWQGWVAMLLTVLSWFASAAYHLPGAVETACYDAYDSGIIVRDWVDMGISWYGTAIETGEIQADKVKAAIAILR